MALLDLPSPLLVRISAYLSERDLDCFTRACTTTQRLLRDNKPLYAACRALGFKTSRAARLSAGLTRSVYRPDGEAKQVDPFSMARSVHPGLTPGEVLCRPQLAEWVLWCAGLRGDGRAMDWVLGMSDASMAYILRHTNAANYDRAWAVAAGAAAARPSPSFFHALCAMPCAPGQLHGLRRANRDFLTTLLSFAVTGPDPDTALDMVMPLCWLPFGKAGFVRVGLYWEYIGDRDQEGKLMGALHGAALHALRNGYTAALAALSRQGLYMENVFTSFAQECGTHAHGIALRTLLQETAYPSTNYRPFRDTLAQSGRLVDAWGQALRDRRIPCLCALMESCGDQLFDTIMESPLILARRNKPADLPMLRCILEHLFFHDSNPAYCDEEALITAIRRGNLPMVEMLLDYGWEATEACIQAAVKSPVILRKLLEDAAAGGADYLALELPPALVISAMYRAAVVYYERASQVVRMRSAHVLLEHLLQRPGVHAWLMKVYAGYKGDEGDAAPTEDLPDESAHGLWADGDKSGVHLLHTLFILEETRLLEAVVRLSKSISADKALLWRFACHCASHPGPSPPRLLLLLHDRGVTFPYLLRALCRSSSDPNVALRLLKHTAWFRDRFVRPGCTPRYICRQLDELYEVNKAIADVRRQYIETGCDSSFALLRVLVSDVMQGRSRLARLRFTWLEQYHSRHHYRLLRWVLESLGLEALGLDAGMCEGVRADSAPLQAELIARWAPLPFVMLCVAHGVAAEPLLSGLCQRPDPPLTLIKQLLQAEPVCMSRNSSSEGPRARHLHGTPRPDVDWAGGRMLRHAAAAGSATVISLLLGMGPKQTGAAVHNPNTPPCIALQIIRARGEIPSALNACSLGGVVQQLIDMGVGPEDLQRAAAPMQCHAAMESTQLPTENAREPSRSVERPTVPNTQQNSGCPVLRLFANGSRAASALYGAMLGAHERMVKWLMHKATDP